MKTINSVLFSRFTTLALLSMLMASQANAWCWWWDRGKTKTENPIVLAHGAFGFDNALGIADYWYEIEDSLRSCRGATVYTTSVSPSNTTEVRGEQLLSQIEDIVASTGANKVNIIGHSMGGLDARYVAEIRPDLVASVTTIGSPHKGTKAFEQFAGLVTEDGLFGALIPIFDDGIGILFELITGTPQPIDAVGAIQAQLPANQLAWNQQYPHGVPVSECGEGNAVETINGHSIRYYSWTGDNPVPWTSSLNPLAVLDLGINTVMGIVGGLGNHATDGVVEVCSAHLGDVIRDNYNWNHLDEINQLFGITADFETDPVGVFKAHANRLKNAGL